MLIVEEEEEEEIDIVFHIPAFICKQVRDKDPCLPSQSPNFLNEDNFGSTPASMEESHRAIVCADIALKAVFLEAAPLWAYLFRAELAAHSQGSSYLVSPQSNS